MKNHPDVIKALEGALDYFSTQSDEELNRIFSQSKGDVERFITETGEPGYPDNVCKVTDSVYSKTVLVPCYIVNRALYDRPEITDMSGIISASSFSATSAHKADVLFKR